MDNYSLPKPSVPIVPRKLSDEGRRDQIYKEIIESKSEILILLGDKPIQWFLKFFDQRWNKLSEFGTANQYGQIHQAKLKDKDIHILPIAHPRQIAKLGMSSEMWFAAHQNWLKKSASQIGDIVNSL
jgi:uracil-DNA glycosylase